VWDETQRRRGAQPGEQAGVRSELPRVPDRHLAYGEHRVLQFLDLQDEVAAGLLDHLTSTVEQVPAVQVDRGLEEETIGARLFLVVSPPDGGSRPEPLSAQRVMIRCGSGIPVQALALAADLV